MPKRTAVRVVTLSVLALMIWLLGGTAPTSQASAPQSQPSDAAARALAHVRANAASLGVSPEDLAELAVSDNYFSKQSGLTLVYLQQELDGIRVHNAIVNLALTADGSVVHTGNRAVAGLAATANRGAPALAPEQAVSAAAASVELSAPAGLSRTREGNEPSRPVTFNTAGIAAAPITTRLVWQPVEGAVRLAWEVYIETLDHQHAWQVRVDAATGEVLDKNDLIISESWGTPGKGAHSAASHVNEGSLGLPEVAPAAQNAVGDSYRVYPVPVESPNHISPAPPADGRTLVTDPDDAVASPFGWHDTNGAAGPEFTIPRGNNVHAYEDRDSNNTPPASEPSGGAGPLLTFDFPLDLTQAPAAYIPAAVTNLFYWNNVIHDLNYHYGFDEVAGNFQVNNYGNGGLGNDDVRAEAQDGSGTNNANFFTPVDGQRPRMQMYIWTAPTPDKDGDLDNGIILHEYGHGISIRLTGGPSNVSCLNNAEQGGEGWSDWQTIVFTALPGHTATTNRGVGTYALNQPVTGPGIRTHPYNTDMTVDPRTYQSTRTAAVPHGVGSIWTAILWEGYWALTSEYGFEPNFYNHTSTAGNIRMIRLVNEAMKLQPCSPGFVDARNAILAANQAIYAGEGQCLLWEAFAKRGLGEDAVQGSSSSNADNTNGFAIPAGCSFVEGSPEAVNICAGQPATYTIQVGTAYTPPVTLSATGQPAGTTVTFNPNPVPTVPSTSTMTVSNTGAVPAGSYTITVTGTDATQSATTTVDLNVFSGSPSAPTLTSPANGSTGTPLQPNFTWSAVANANGYVIEVDDNSDFSSIVYTATVSGTSHTPTTPLAPNTTYFWRVKAQNPCGTGAASAAFSFTTANQLCLTPNAAIPDNSPTGVTSVFTVPTTGTITDLNVSLDIAHTWVGDVQATLTHNGTTVNIFDRPGVPASTFGCSGDNVDAILDDEAAAPVEAQCAAGVPTINGTFQPNQSLSGFDGMELSGTWTLFVRDWVAGDSGTLNEWCLIPATSGGATPTPTTVPPTATATTVPPTATATTVPPTATATMAPPTVTATLPPGTTPTATVPPTSIELGSVGSQQGSPMAGWLLSLAGLALVAAGMVARRRR